MAKQVSATEATDRLRTIFSSAATRATFDQDFAKLDKLQKCTYVKEFFGNEVWTHQIDPLDGFTNPMEKSSTTNISRQAGKGQLFAWAQGINAAHNLCPDLGGVTRVLSLANKESQALIVAFRLRSLLENNIKKTQFYWDQAGSTKTFFNFKREAGVNTRTMGTVQYLTANPTAFSEGFTSSALFIDEAGRLDAKVYSEVILPFGSSTNAKIILTGVSRGRGPFYDACNSRDYKHYHYPWDKVETYSKAAPVELLDPVTNEVILKTGFYPLDMMPITLKKLLFPTNPICHLLPAPRQAERFVRLWELSDGKMSEDDFRSQYMLEWLADLMAILQLGDQILMFDNPTFALPSNGIPEEEYFFGFDLGGSRNVYASGNHDKDTAALAIWRKKDGIKQKIFADELYSCQPTEAVNWLMNCVHPQYGMFPCKYGAVDVTGSLGALTSEHLVKSGLPIVPIFYNRVEETTKKNYKNAMFDYFKIEASGGRCQYPPKEYTDSLDEVLLKPKYPIWSKCREQWEIIEKQETGGNNAKIGAPSGEHDDHPNADVMAVYVMDRPQQFSEYLVGVKKRRCIPVRMGGLAGSAGGGGITGASINLQNMSRPLNRGLRTWGM